MEKDVQRQDRSDGRKLTRRKRPVRWVGIGLAAVLALVLAIGGIYTAGKHTPAKKQTAASVSKSFTGKSTDIRKATWGQLPNAVRSEITGSWGSGRVQKWIVGGHEFAGADKYKGQELVMISYPSKDASPTLGPVTVFVDPVAMTWVGTGFRD